MPEPSAFMLMVYAIIFSMLAQGICASLDTDVLVVEENKDALLLTLSFQ